MGQKTCSPICETERKRQTKIRKYRVERLKTRQDYLKEAQVEFNKYIRLRDRLAGLPCISCGRNHTGDNHAGHYRSVGAAPHLRFNEDNVHLQCAPCNTYLSGNAIEYRIKLIQRIGVERVEALEASHGSVKYTIEDAKRIKAEYKEKVKALEAQS
jgi:hypothetical protein